MGCCNQAPNGGTKQLGLLFKLIAAIFIVIMVIGYFSN
ncbi:hypothetical protein JCM19231_4836 [Vibrio ishigakensis]|uniref:Uncharacterized protein n=1 Tax=Vibrio ishigakensis TaxID=1481914 RepID=A0A0B8P867_9VIBR|nr:hypothetical protein JCM19231_4836 [Vibrio ishigakensis]